jgi:hypothetical protein
MNIVVPILVVLLVLAVGLVSAVAKDLVKDEVRAWIPHLTKRLVDRWARRLPAYARERWHQDALSDLGQFDDRPMTALVHALLMWWTLRELVAELGPDPVSITVSVDDLARWRQRGNRVVRAQLKSRIKAARRAARRADNGSLD